MRDLPLSKFKTLTKVYLRGHLNLEICLRSFFSYLSLSLVPTFPINLSFISERIYHFILFFAIAFVCIIHLTKNTTLISL